MHIDPKHSFRVKCYMWLISRLIIPNLLWHHPFSWSPISNSPAHNALGIPSNWNSKTKSNYWRFIAACNRDFLRNVWGHFRHRVNFKNEKREKFLVKFNTYSDKRIFILPRLSWVFDSISSFPSINMAFIITISFTRKIMFIIIKRGCP